ncbi:MAG: hypothetical protein L0Z50_23140, partial [Verrucomicrobiales bacterium]|nr:hypothetical protein [Verrucomicrobiales bacterium]
MRVDQFGMSDSSIFNTREVCPPCAPGALTGVNQDEHRALIKGEGQRRGQFLLMATSMFSGRVHQLWHLLSKVRTDPYGL